MNRTFTAVLAVLIFLGGVLSIGNLFEWVDSAHAVRIQYPWGTVTWFTDAQGPKVQVFGSVKTYDRRGTIEFQPPPYKEAPDARLPIGFNDAGTGKIKGSINYELSTDHAKLEEMYKRYATQAALESSLISPALKGSIYLTGQLMSSFESYSSRKSELVQYVEDQTQRGVYMTRSVSVEVPDELDDKKTKFVMKTEIITDTTGQRRRVAIGEVERFGVRVYNFAIEDLAYDERVKAQIEQQQGITMAVQTAKAKALEAQQNEVTAGAEGRAKAETAKQAQSAINAKLVEEAKGHALAAEQDKLAADFTRQKDILLAQGKAESARLQVAAGLSPTDKGALWLESQKVWANAYANASQPLVPNVVLGGGGSGVNALSGAQLMMDAMGVKAMRDLGLDLAVSHVPSAGTR